MGKDLGLKLKDYDLEVISLEGIETNGQKIGFFGPFFNHKLIVEDSKEGVYCGKFHFFSGEQYGLIVDENMVKLLHYENIQNVIHVKPKSIDKRV